MSLILGLDFETQGLDQFNTRATEVGAVLLNTKTGEKESYSALMWSEDYLQQTPEVVELTGLTDTMLQKDGRDPIDVWAELVPIVEKADIVFAYKVNFDRVVFEKHCERFGIPIPKKEWICALSEVPYPKKYTCRKLSHLALDHGIKMDGRSLHRAVEDVELMLDLLALYPLDEVLAYAREPWVYLQAVIAKPWEDGGKGKDAAKAAGFSWQQVPGDDRVFNQLWIKRVKARQVEAERNGKSFCIRQLT